ncbi:hypothetical protein WJX74_002116 [Apatococcus lobatus]|uniref:Mitochondrial carrier protein n=1 Tax=Apatococcus lobatus TaxID=904363 RepID=A0AAW1RRM9_9CHLO
MPVPERTKAPADVDWNRLDKTKFLVYGAGIFSSVTTVLFPLSVIKTRQMAIESASPGLSGSAKMARQVWQADGIRGFYRGFGTIVFGAIPARGIYLTTLEAARSGSSTMASRFTSTEAQAAGVANFVAGATASCVTQTIVVPIDVVSQRQMIAEGSRSAPTQKQAAPQGAGSANQRSGFKVMQHILRNEGILGLYRGFGASLFTFVPSSAVWWSAYGAYQKLVWREVERWGGPQEQNVAQDSRGVEGRPQGKATAQVMAVQTSSALLSGLTAATLTNPLDVIKTRLQVAERQAGHAKPTFAGIARKLIADEGPRGLLKGVAPRMASTALWGTCMVSAYEFLKRLCTLPEPD